jgi:hypothetical protein
MTLSLNKIEEGFCRGNVVYHSHINKSSAEVKKQMDSLKNKRDLKAHRKKEQEDNVRRKAEKRGEIQPEDKPEADSEVKDEGEDQKVLGKRSREEATKSKSAPKAAPKKPMAKPEPVAPKMRGQTIKKSKAPAAIRKNPKLLPTKGSSRPSTKEARLKRLGKYIGDKKEAGKAGAKPSGKRVGTPTFKKSKNGK